MPRRSNQTTAQEPGPPPPQTRPSGSARAERRTHTRAAILESAARVFAARGYEGATLREIAARCGVGQPLLVYHFESKEGLWRASVERLFSRLIEAVREGSSWAEAAESREVVRAVLRSFIEVVAAEPAWLQILLREAAEPGPRLDWLVEHHSRQTYEAGVGFLDSAKRLGLLPDLPTDHLLYVLVGALTFVVAIAPEVRRVTGARVDSGGFLDRHVDTFMALLMPPIPKENQT
jgi:AcrR family transcriptional regulator